MRLYFNFKSFYFLNHFNMNSNLFFCCFFVRIFFGFLLFRLWLLFWFFFEKSSLKFLTRRGNIDRGWAGQGYLSCNHHKTFLLVSVFSNCGIFGGPGVHKLGAQRVDQELFVGLSLEVLLVILDFKSSQTFKDLLSFEVWDNQRIDSMRLCQFKEFMILVELFKLIDSI